ncbi:MAG TPA: peptidase S41, partial [Chitinophagaceae bacterium]
MRSILILLFVTIGMAGCGVGKSSFSPTRKYSLQEVQKDYTLYQEILESHHPSLYWYTPKDS